MEQRLIDWSGNNLPTLGPKSVAVVLTNACNLSCVTCWSYSPLLTNTKPTISWKKQHLSFELLPTLFSQLRDMQVERIILTGGGDPLAYPKFEEAVQLIHQNKLKTTLISNLSLVRDVVSFKNLQIDTILANCSAVDSKSYINFHHNRTAVDFEKFKSILEQLSETTKQLKLVFVICRINAHLLSQFLEFAATLRANVQFKLMSIAAETQAVAITEPIKENLLQEIPHLTQIAKQLNIKTNLDTLASALQGETATSFPIEKTGCSAGYFYARITAAGEVLFCCNPNKLLKIGSLFQNSFKELWDGERWQEIRLQLHQNHFFNGCERCGKFDLNLVNFQKITLGAKTDSLLAGS